MNRRTVAVIVGATSAFVLLVLAFIAALFFGIFKLLDRADAHVCGLAYVQRSPVARRLLGTPIVQDGFTGGRSTDKNGEVYERLTFNVKGPLGTAFVLSEGIRSPIESRLRVTVGRNGNGETIYSGRFDCPELHVR